MEACCCFEDKSVPLDFAAYLKYSLLQSNTLQATTAGPWGWVCEILPSAYRSSTINRSSRESPGYSIKSVTFLSWHMLSVAFAYMVIQLNLHWQWNILLFRERWPQWVKWAFLYKLYVRNMWKTLVFQIVSHSTQASKMLFIPQILAEFTS